MSNYKEDLRNVKAFVFDVDGVFTNGSIFLDPGGEFIRMMNIKDGYAIQYCIKHGYPVAVITGGNSKTVKKRFKNLGVNDIYLRSSQKIDDYEDFRSKYKLEHKNILFMGDDIPDYEIMKKAGVPTCPDDAVEEIKHHLPGNLLRIKGNPLAYHAVVSSHNHNSFVLEARFYLASDACYLDGELLKCS